MAMPGFPRYGNLKLSSLTLEPVKGALNSRNLTL